MTLLGYTALAVGFVGIEQLYVSIARRFRLFERQTERSLHVENTVVRGGGILFYVAALFATYLDDRSQRWFLAGLTLVALVSLLDDLFSLAKRYRLLAHGLAIGLVIHQETVVPTTLWITVGAVIAGVGILNMCNFMDGINGMTALYGLVTVGTLWAYQVPISGSSSSLCTCVGLSLLVFSFYNARRQAICFAGDVGSIALGFIIVYKLFQLIHQEHTYLPLLVLAVYGVDTTLTLLHRLYEGENIVQAHRLHLFQLIVHQRKGSHLAVAGAYASLQGLINLLIYQGKEWEPLRQISLATVILSSLCITYVIVKKPLMPKKRSARAC